MNGPEHYREAERLLAIPVSTDPADQGAVIALHLAAQAHAMLAQTAATVMAADLASIQANRARDDYAGPTVDDEWCCTWKPTDHAAAPTSERGA